jgi:Fur family transcriptional regulator, ferric uptake regulator
MRETPQRRAIVNALDSFTGTFTAIELHERARAQRRGLGLATTYRMLDLLRNEGAVRPVPGSTRGEYIRCHPGHHHHLVCLVCGSVEETELCAAPSTAELKRKHGFRPEMHEVEIYGTCARCA